MTWEAKWANYGDAQLEGQVNANNQARYERYSRTILLNIRPTNTLDIGGGTGGLGAYLPGKYTVMDHPRMRQFCKWANWIPIGPITEKYDLVVSTNALSESPLPEFKNYMDQIEALGVEHIYLSGRKMRHGFAFEQWPIQNWEPLVVRGFGGRGSRFMEFLGKLKR